MFDLLKMNITCYNPVILNIVSCCNIIIIIICVILKVILFNIDKNWTQL